MTLKDIFFAIPIVLLFCFFLVIASSAPVPAMIIFVLGVWATAAMVYFDKKGDPSEPPPT